VPAEEETFVASRLRVAVSLGALALLLAACGSGSHETAGGSETGTRVEPATSALPETIPEAPTPASGAVPWPAPANTLEVIARAGLEPLRQELLAFHIHSHLDVFVNGEPVVVPAGIGINLVDSGLQQGDGCEQPCISPLHTHKTDGILHVESAEDVPFTLGEFFAEWDVRLDATCIGGYCRPEAPISVYVDGQPYGADPAEIRLNDLEEIAIVIGTPPATIPDSYEGFEPVA
jgi:hypothetical protein